MFAGFCYVEVANRYRRLKILQRKIEGRRRGVEVFMCMGKCVCVEVGGRWECVVMLNNFIREGFLTFE